MKPARELPIHLRIGDLPEHRIGTLTIALTEDDSSASGAVTLSLADALEATAAEIRNQHAEGGGPSCRSRLAPPPSP